MRKITFSFSDLDVVTNEVNVFEDCGLLIAPTIVIHCDKMGLFFYYLPEALADNETVVNVQDALIVSIDIRGASVADYDIEKLAGMTIAELAQEFAR